MQAIPKFAEVFPTRLKVEIFSLLNSRKKSTLSEIRLRDKGVSTVTVGREKIRLSVRLKEGDSDTILHSLIELAPYLYRDSISEGYIILEGGVRVGACGRARYDGERLVGVSQISSLVFRIPSGECELKDEVYSAFLGSDSGLLIYSKPGRGKTTALRELAFMIGSGKNSKNVTVVDERLEFIAEKYKGCSVDLLRGYKRERGMEIALRSLSSEVIMIDEIGSLSETRLLCEFMRCGVKIVASAHAGSLSELYSRPGVRELIDMGVFDTLFGIENNMGKRSYILTDREKIKELSEAFQYGRGAGKSEYELANEFEKDMGRVEIKI